MVIAEAGQKERENEIQKKKKSLALLLFLEMPHRGEEQRKGTTPRAPLGLVQERKREGGHG